MIQKQKNIQIALILAGVILFFLTYFYLPGLNKIKDIDNKTSKSKENVINDGQSTNFENLEFKGLYDFNNPFVVKSETAYTLNDEPDIIYMKKMNLLLYLKDGRIVEITSQKGSYNKINYNCYFEQEVLVTDGETKITADNLDLIAEKNFVEIYNNVNLDHISGQLHADKINYDFETKHFKVSMFGSEFVKMRIIQ